MAETKITRDNHPIIVRVRNEAYREGYCIGYQEGFQNGHERSQHILAESYKQEILHLRVIIRRLMKESDT